MFTLCRFTSSCLFIMDSTFTLYFILDVYWTKEADLQISFDYPFVEVILIQIPEFISATQSLYE